MGSEVGSSELEAGSVEEELSEDSLASLDRFSEEEASLELGSVSELDETGSEVGSSEESEEAGWCEELLLEGASGEKPSVEEGVEVGSLEETLSAVDEMFDLVEAGEEQLKRSRRRVPSDNSLRGAFCITGIIKDMHAFSYD